MSNHLAAAMKAATARGFRLRVDPARPDLCEVVCRSCGYGAGHWDQDLDRYAKSGGYTCDHSVRPVE